MGKPSPCSKTKKKPKLKVLASINREVQADILGQLLGMAEMAKEGKIAQLVCYCEATDGHYSIHTTPCEDAVRTAGILFQLAISRVR